MKTYLKKLFKLLSKNERRKLILVFGGVLLLGILELVGIGSIMPFLSVASKPELIQSNKYLSWVYTSLGFKDTNSFLFALACASLVFIIFSNSMKALVFYMIRKYTAMRQHYLSVRLFRRYLYRPYTFFLNRNTSELMKNILSEVQTLINGALMPLLNLITSVVITFLIITMMVVVEPKLALITFLVIGSIYGLIYIVVKGYLNTLGKRRIKANELRYKRVSEALSGIKDVKVLGREESFLKEFIPPSRENAKVQVTSGLIGSIPKYVLEIVAFGGILIVILYLIRTMGNFQEAVPVIGLYSFAAYRIMPSVQKIFATIAKIRTNLPVVDLIHKNLGDWKAAEKQIKKFKEISIEPVVFQKQIKLDSVRFIYPGSDVPVIMDQTVIIRKNTTVGFVGPTGCGKTTIVDIILGLLIPQEGCLKIDGTEIMEANISFWQKHVGYVPQHIFLSDDSVARNIAFGVPDNDIDMKAVEKAARIADIHDFIVTDMTEGYNTVVGERGLRLSGGQQQRIGIARALYNDPSVLVLDEATSALDGMTEAVIMDAIRKLGHKKTIIMIAHRLSTVKDCDEIFVMDSGKVVDKGTYNKLLEYNERFRRISELS